MTWVDSHRENVKFHPIARLVTVNLINTLYGLKAMCTNLYKYKILFFGQVKSVIVYDISGIRRYYIIIIIEHVSTLVLWVLILIFIEKLGM